MRTDFARPQSPTSASISWQEYAVVCRDAGQRRTVASLQVMVCAGPTGVEHLLTSFEQASEADRVALLVAALEMQPGASLQVAEWVAFEEGVAGLRDWAIATFANEALRHDPAGQVVALDAHQDEVDAEYGWMLMGETQVAFV